MLAQRRHAVRVAKKHAEILALLPKKMRWTERVIGRVGGADDGFNVYTVVKASQQKTSIGIKGGRVELAE